MTPQDYLRAKEAIEAKYRDDMAAIERAWTIIHGTKAPDGVVEPEEQPGLHSAADLGIHTAARSEDGHRQYKKRESLAGLTAEQKKAHKAAYMKTYLAKRRANGK